jgi:hypothetical protein|nr:MAG TPA: hypothetical protein [Caudoviricetes sp.]
MFWVWFAAITLATIAGIVVCVAQVINSIEIMKHKKRTWLDITIVCILDALVLFIAGSIGYVWASLVQMIQW